MMSPAVPRWLPRISGDFGAIREFALRVMYFLDDIGDSALRIHAFRWKIANAAGGTKRSKPET